MPRGRGAERAGTPRAEAVSAAGKAPRAVSPVNAANLISLARLLAVPVVVWLIIMDEFAFAFWLFVAAGISDAIDGFLAKRFGAITELGAYLDPLADKVLLVSIYIALGLQEILAAWLVILVVSRDVLIMGGVVLAHALERPKEIRPLLVSKINTTFQILLAAWILAERGLGMPPFYVVETLVYLVAATTLLSGASYLRSWLVQMTNGA